MRGFLRGVGFSQHSELVHINLYDMGGIHIESDTGNNLEGNRPARPGLVTVPGEIHLEVFQTAQNKLQYFAQKQSRNALNIGGDYVLVYIYLD